MLCCRRLSSNERRSKGVPLVDRSNTTVGIIAIFRDVTEQVRAKAKIDDEVRRRDQFLAMLSHELRNPLGSQQRLLMPFDRTLKSETWS